MSVAILELTCTGNHLHTLEVQGSLIPAWFLLVQTGHRGSHHLITGIHGRVHGTFLLEILHRGSIRLDNDKIYSRAYLVTLGEMYITGTISADIILKHRIHSYLLYVGKEGNSIIDIIDEYLFVKIS